ncbi:uncharacterized protein LOC101863832 [Aplysia californica]|uniref:Uncharacterized protein LOC101863832 n=1 Tax=Aplysia californica TaxID=6500 RepID=A0ABM0JXA5_APLCA|nr:uncharacterized protein LOC101863832 [Aplysia californica]
MKAVALLMVIAHVALGDSPDPTKVCMPDQLSATEFNLMDASFANVTVDFGKKRSARLENGVRTVVDYANLKAYVIDSNGCTSSAASPYQLLFKCLPAMAKYAGQLAFGVESPRTLDVWRLNLGTFNLTMLGSTTPGVGSYPVLRKLFTPSGFTISLLENARPKVFDPTVLDIPNDCTEAPVVG